MQRISVKEYHNIIAATPLTGKRRAKPRLASSTWTAAGYLERLMTRPPLSDLVKLGPEDRLAIDFTRLLTAWTLSGALRAVWTHAANEVGGGTANAGIRYAVAKSMGLTAGTADYLFMGNGFSAALEAKAEKGTQTPNQRDFELWCRAHDVPYTVFKTVRDGAEHLVSAGILRADALNDIV